MKKMAFVLALVLVIVLGVVAYAVAANPETVTVQAKPNQKLTLAVDSGNIGNPNLVDLTATPFDPGQDYTNQGSVAVTVQSNKAWTVTALCTAGTLSKLTNNLGTSWGGNATAGSTQTDKYTVAVPWTADPASTLSGTVRYTATQP